MCCDEDNSGTPLSFNEFVRLLQEPPFEPCASELEFLTPIEYEKAFTEIVRHYSKRITCVIARITEDPSRSAELAQDVFISLYKARTSFEPCYIYRAAKNAAFSELRRRHLENRILRAHWAGVRLTKEQESKDLDAPDPRPLPDAAFLERARADALRLAIGRLPECFRVALVLLAEGKSYKQIMTMTQANEGTVKARICRGKRVLRRKLRAYLQ